MRKPLIVLATGLIALGMTGCGPKHQNNYCVDQYNNVVDSSWCHPGNVHYNQGYSTYTTTHVYHSGQHASGGSVSHKTPPKVTKTPSKAQPTKKAPPKVTHKPSKPTKKK